MAGRTPYELEDWTWGEAVLLVQSVRKAERQRYQAESVIAWEAAVLMAKCLAGEEIQPVYACFPFWEEEERQTLRLAGYRAMMERIAAGRKERDNE